MMQTYNYLLKAIIIIYYISKSIERYYNPPDVFENTKSDKLNITYLILTLKVNN